MYIIKNKILSYTDILSKSNGNTIWTSLKLYGVTSSATMMQLLNTVDLINLYKKNISMVISYKQVVWLVRISNFPIVNYKPFI